MGLRHPSSAQQGFSEPNSPGIIHIQQKHRSPSFCSSPVDDCTRAHEEMLPPHVQARRIERNDRLCFGIHRSDIRPFFQVTTNATQTEIGCIVGATVLSPNDVVNLVGNGRGIFRQMAVLACFLRSSNHPLSNFNTKGHDATRTDCNSSASSFISLSMSFTRTICAYSSYSSAVSIPAVLFRASSSTRGARSLLSASSAASRSSRVRLSIMGSCSHHAMGWRRGQAPRLFCFHDPRQTCSDCFPIGVCS